jgi:hypothetical protein
VARKSGDVRQTRKSRQGFSLGSFDNKLNGTLYSSKEQLDRLVARLYRSFGEKYSVYSLRSTQ